MSTNKVKVTINGITGEVEEGKTLLEASEELGAPLMHACFGNGLCSTCRVEVYDGAKSLSPAQIKERVCLEYRFCFDPNTRLACQTKITGTEKIEVAAPQPFARMATFIAKLASRSPFKKKKATASSASH
jgi:ferredoxin